MTETANMADAKATFQIQPGRGLGWMTLGASIHGIMSRIKSQPQLYPGLRLSYSLEEPISRPLNIDLPDNDIRLRFDGPDQRLRLIEINGWSESTFTYKSVEVVRHNVSSDRAGESGGAVQGTILPGPSFRHIYNRLFGPAYAGEYIPPSTGQSLGTYVLSYPGLAIRFPLKHSAYSDKADFVSLLSSAALPATSIAIFTGSSWPEARDTLFTKTPSLPRSIALASKNNETVPDEIDNIIIHGEGRIELLRRSSPSFTIVLSETTPQDLVAELGPPDAIFRKSSTRISIHAGYQAAADQSTNISQTAADHSSGTGRPSSTSRTGSIDNDTETSASNHPGTDGSTANAECFYNYFHHGLDVLISKPAVRSPPFPGHEATHHQSSRPTTFENKLVATKIFLHGNIPGSYSFNRHRRSRWVIPLPPIYTALTTNIQPLMDFDLDLNDTSPPTHASKSKDKRTPSTKQHHHHHHSEPEDPGRLPSHPAPSSNTLTSEMQFPQIAQALTSLWSSSSSNPGPKADYPSKGMVLNRGWSADQDSSPESSVELLGGTMTMDDSSIVSAPVLKNDPFPQTASTSVSRANRAGTSEAAATAAVEKTGGNTQLFGFPGLLFEVLDHGGISCVTVY